MSHGQTPCFVRRVLLLCSGKCKFEKHTGWSVTIDLLFCPQKTPPCLRSLLHSHHFVTATNTIIFSSCLIGPMHHNPGNLPLINTLLRRHHDMRPQCSDSQENRIENLITDIYFNPPQHNSQTTMVQNLCFAFGAKALMAPYEGCCLSLLNRVSLWPPQSSCQLQNAEPEPHSAQLNHEEIVLSVI